MKKWEYLVEESVDKSSDPMYATKHLNARGEEGWELAVVIEHSQHARYFVFKRAKETPPC